MKGAQAREFALTWRLFSPEAAARWRLIRELRVHPQPASRLRPTIAVQRAGAIGEQDPQPRHAPPGAPGEANATAW